MSEIFHETSVRIIRPTSLEDILQIDNDFPDIFLGRRPSAVYCLPSKSLSLWSDKKITRTNKPLDETRLVIKENERH